jgi:hypothetical protein
MQHSALPYVDANVWYITLLFGNEAIARNIYLVLSDRYSNFDTDYPYHFASDIEV